MSYVINGIYVLGLLLLSPWLVYQALTTGKYRRGLARKLWGQSLLRDGDAPCAWFHGVSVGEVHLLRQVVARFRQRHPGWDCAISTTTDTGFDEACKLFPDLPVFYWPFDFTWAVHRALRRVNPSLVVLAEGELWPNFLAAAAARGIPVVVVNGRLSPRSFARYRRLGFLTSRLFGHLRLAAVQTEEYAGHFRGLGCPPDRVHVTGSVKYDGVMTDRLNPRTLELREQLGIRPGEIVWVAGSTQDPEERLVLDAYGRLKGQHPGLRLAIVPRQKDRFDAVAGLLHVSGHRFVRRSQLTAPLSDPSVIVLMDTMGELGALWGLADVAFVGGSLDGRRGGQNMIEPAAYGAAVIFGPHVWNFRDVARRLIAAGGAIQVADAASLERVVGRLLRDAAERQTLGTAAQQLVRSQQGATDRTIGLLAGFLVHAPGRQQAA